MYLDDLTISIFAISLIAFGAVLHKIWCVHKERQNARAAYEQREKQRARQAARERSRARRA